RLLGWRAVRVGGRQRERRDDHQREQLTSAALASGTTINRLGLQYDGAGATASGAIISGSELVAGAAIGGTGVPRGTLIVQLTGVASGVQVSGGGATMLVENGGSASGTSVGSGGLLDVLAGGTAVITQVNGGGRAIIGTGANGGAARISGGIFEI